ncbi:CYTH domain-containing protein [Wenyingzhuangia marina]|uniref:CYTH domain-containing protein n=1 Tax=Wenyingzhuangia marina TaxID=1195760 RepID=A0A1M5SV32_9FLAO|nr:CYTH domain-containing protein [Wenyingzhuangia marina]GGF64217.1 CYTH domain-containing protein [Wenyingzhuangia marina]SHH42421.1 CYTH domain-containing protein [Wenyingzhuangia marina]
MNYKEIERKFLINNLNFIKESFDHNRIEQGYLNSNKNRAVRVRIKNNHGFLTIKGSSNESGTTRFEWEKEIPVAEAKQLIAICEPGVISKTRYLVKANLHTFEVDVFDGDNQGLIVAEVELSSENETFEKPEWLGKEVTGEVKYYNSQLSKNPYKNW